MDVPARDGFVAHVGGARGRGGNGDGLLSAEDRCCWWGRRRFGLHGRGLGRDRGKRDDAHERVLDVDGSAALGAPRSGSGAVAQLALVEAVAGLAARAHDDHEVRLLGADGGSIIRIGSTGETPGLSPLAERNGSCIRAAGLK